MQHGWISLPISASKCCVPNAQLLNFSFLLSLSLTPKVIYLIFGGERNCQSWDLKSFTHADLVFINYEVWIGMATGTSPMRKNSPYHLCLEVDIEKSRKDDTWWRLILFYSRHTEDSVISPWLASWIPCEDRVKQYVEAWWYPAVITDTSTSSQLTSDHTLVLVLLLKK